jgi:alkaline phosphatase D
LVCSSITSGGDGSDSRTGSHPWLAGGQNPHLRFQNSLRGYVRTMITREEMTADFRVLPYVSRPGAEAFTRPRSPSTTASPGWTSRTTTSPPRGRAAASPSGWATPRSSWRPSAPDPMVVGSRL